LFRRALQQTFWHSDRHLLAVLLLPVAAALAQTRGTPPSVAPAPATAQPGAQQPSDHEPPSDPEREVFLESMSLIPFPGKGCFKAVFPNKIWQPAECASPPATPNPRALQPRADRLTVGKGTDYFLLSDSPSITSATGSFPSVNGVKSVYSPTVMQPNTYALQMNSNTFNSSFCDNCTVWQQFIFSQSQCGQRQPCVFIEYWLLNYSSSCPPGWYRGTVSDCFLNAMGTIVDPPLIEDLAKLKLKGTVSTTTADNTVVDAAVLLTADGTVWAAQGTPFGLAGAWQGAEFNLFGDCCGYGAYVNSGSNIEVKLGVDNGTVSCTTDPLLFAGGTAETNNLSLVLGSCSATGGSSPAIMFTECGGGQPPQEDTVAGTTRSTASATGETGSTASATLTINVIAPCAAPQ